jgi:hypothetical protein
VGIEDKHPALARLDVLVGRWSVQPVVEGVPAGWTEFAWQDGGLFLRQVADADPMPSTAPTAWQQNAPFPTTAMIGLDDADGEFTVLYADARGVHRVYRMTFAEGVWTMWRYAPGFDQRFTGTFSADGDTVHARWELSRDGVNWDTDFELVYTRL